MLDYNTLAKEYARHRRIHPDVLKDLIETGGLTPASRVLEVGCGTGNYAIALQNASSCSVWGIDPSEQMLAIARGHSQDVRFRTGRAEQLDFPSESFALVFSVDVIHHLADQPAYYHEVFRVLGKGGKVCTVTDSEEIIHHRQPLAVYFPETVDVELRRYPRIADLADMMGQAGFTGLQNTLVEFPYALTDLQAYRDKAFSSLHLIPNDAFEGGLRRMEENLRRGPIPCVSRYLLLWGTK